MLSAQDLNTTRIKEGVHAYQDGTLKQQPELVHQLELLAEKEKSIDAAFLLATAYKNGVLQENPVDNALRWYVMAAEQQDHDAELMIGWLYYEGRPYLKKNLELSKKWFKKASDGGLIEGTQMLNMLDNL